MEHILPESSIQKLKDQWNLSGELHFVQKTANYVYIGEVDGKRMVIKITAPFRRSFESIQAEVAWASYLHTHGAPVAAPLYLPILLEGYKEPLTAVAIDFAPGHLPRREELTPAFLRKLGANLARLHEISSRYPVAEENSSRHNWKGQIWPTIDRYVTLGLEQSTVKRLLSLAEVLKVYPKSLDTYSLIHADLHPDNLFITDEGEITIFDFDTCCYHWHLYDVAITVLQAHEYFDRFGVAISRNAVVEHLFAGYRTVRELDGTDLDMFLQLRAYVFICWARVQLASRELDPKGRQWLERMLKWMSNETL